MATQKIIKTAQELGEIVAAIRIEQRLRADDFCVSHVCLSGIERGRGTAQIGKVLEVLAELGIRVKLEMPPGMKVPEGSALRRRRISR